MSPIEDPTRHQSHHSANASATEIDPVCGMSVDPSHAAGSVRHAGRQYYFCSTHCTEKFRASPATYLSPAPADLVQLGSVAQNPAVSSNAIEYTCPMHSEVVNDRPGPCPLCGMALEPRTITLDEGPSP